MRTAAQYQHDVDELKIDEIKTADLSEKEARKGLQTLTDVHEKLHQIEANLNLDLHALDRQYQGRATSISVQSAGRGGRARTEEGQRLDEEKHHKLGAYEDVKKKIEEILSQIEQKRVELEKAAPGTKQKS